MERTRPVPAMTALQASQQASMMAARSLNTRLERYEARGRPKCWLKAAPSFADRWRVRHRYRSPTCATGADAPRVGHPGGFTSKAAYSRLPGMTSHLYSSPGGPDHSKKAAISRTGAEALLQRCLTCANAIYSYGLKIEQRSLVIWARVRN